VRADLESQPDTVSEPCMNGCTVQVKGYFPGFDGAVKLDV
jgi:hypothetical protein